MNYLLLTNLSALDDRPLCKVRGRWGQAQLLEARGVPSLALVKGLRFTKGMGPRKRQNISKVMARSFIPRIDGGPGPAIRASEGVSLKKRLHFDDPRHFVCTNNLGIHHAYAYWNEEAVLPSGIMSLTRTPFVGGNLPLGRF